MHTSLLYMPDPSSYVITIESCAAKTHLLTSLSLSYQKDDSLAGPRQSAIWYDADFTISTDTVKAADNKSIVGVISKEGLAGPTRQSFFWYDNDEDLERTSAEWKMPHRCRHPCV